jgi:hypothetical protein
MSFGSTRCFTSSSDLNDLTLEEEGMGRNHGFLVSKVVAPGDEVPVAFRLAKAIQPLRFWASITYRDLSYQRRYRGRFVFDEKRSFGLHGCYVG